MRYETRLAPARLPLPPTHTDPRGARAMPISTTITASDLGALFSLPSSALDRTTPETMGSARRPPPDRASRTTPTAPPGYGRRAADAWRPRTHADFLDGGAYPEIDVVQLPAGLGWGANAPASDHPDRAWASPPPAALDVNFATLQICAARRALRLDRDSSVSSADARARRARTITPASNHRRVRHRRRLFRARLSIRKRRREHARARRHVRRLDRRVLVRVREHAPRRAPERALATSRARCPAERRRWTRPRTPGSRRPYDRFGRRARLAPGRVVGFRRARRSARRRDGDV